MRDPEKREIIFRRTADGYDAAVSNRENPLRTARDIQNKPTVRYWRVRGAIRGGVYYEPIAHEPMEPLAVVPLYTPYDAQYRHNRRGAETAVLAGGVEAPRLDEAALLELAQRWNALLSDSGLSADRARSKTVLFSSKRLVFEEAKRSAKTDDPAQEPWLRSLSLKPGLVVNGELREDALLRELAKTLDEGELLGVIFGLAGHTDAEILRHQSRLVGDERYAVARQALAAGVGLGNRAPISALRSTRRKLRTIGSGLLADGKPPESPNAQRGSAFQGEEKVFRVPAWTPVPHLVDQTMELLPARLRRDGEIGSCYDRPKVETTAPRRPLVFTIRVPPKFLSSALSARTYSVLHTTKPPCLLGLDAFCMKASRETHY